jgi:hypothetical protein
MDKSVGIIFFYYFLISANLAFSDQSELHSATGMYHAVHVIAIITFNKVIYARMKLETFDAVWIRRFLLNLLLFPLLRRYERGVKQGEQNSESLLRIALLIEVKLARQVSQLEQLPPQIEVRSDYFGGWVLRLPHHFLK